MTPDVSVLLPARDVDPRWWRRALESTLKSREVRLEVVVVDHGSHTPLQVDDGRVRVLRADRTLPFAAALEMGRAACRAEVIARMDADDVMHPLRLRIGKIGPLLGPGPAERPAHPHGEVH